MKYNFPKYVHLSTVRSQSLLPASSPLPLRRACLATACLCLKTALPPRLRSLWTD